MARLRLFAQARDAAGGTSVVEIDADTVGGVLDEASTRFGPAFAEVLGISAVWRNGDPAERDDPAGASDEVAVLPPVSGG